MPFPFTLVVVLFLLFLPSCASLLRESDSEERALAHMKLADSLEQSAAWREAAFEYGLVVQHYPRTQVYPEALRKAALLSLQNGGSAQADSLGCTMVELYLDEGSPTQNERESMETLVALAGRIDSLRRKSQRQGQAVDSLTAALQRQSSSVSGQSQRIVDLEQQLRQATEELRKLKQVDLNISRNRRQKPN